MSLGSFRTVVNALEQYAIDNYEEGGHWVAETYSYKDYVEVLEHNNFNVDEAKKELKQYWEFTNERQRECW